MRCIAVLCYDINHILFQVILLSTAAASWVSIVYKSDHRTSTNYFDVLYDKTWIRISPYLIGLAAGVCVWAMKTRSGLYTETFKTSRHFLTKTQYIYISVVPN